MILRFIALLCLAGTAQAQKPVTPLFAENETLSITLTAPFGELTRRASDDEPQRYAATMQLDGPSPESHAITLQARGNFRRDRSNCRFPPLRLRINEKPGNASLFDRQRSLKLVTHCKDRQTYKDYVLSEYTAYRLYNLLTEASLRVRLLDVTYIDETTGKPVAQQVAFFIEDIDDLASRNAGKEVEVPRTRRADLMAEDAGRLAVFQYMIGNTDWSMLDGRDGDPCCHNMKMVGADKNATTNLRPIPYDFDHSGMVDASYAKPPANLGLRSVTDRRYRGFCDHDAEALATIARTKDLKADLLARATETPGLSDRRRSKIRRYIERYFNEVSDERSVRRNLLSDCR